MIMFWLMMMLLAPPLVSSIVVTEFPLPTTCTGPECDPNWTPFPNMVYALRGYNIRRGDPMKKSGDVGFKNQIFLPSKVNSNNRVELEEGITAVDLTFCQRTLTTKCFSNSNEYRYTEFTNSFMLIIIFYLS